MISSFFRLCGFTCCLPIRASFLRRTFACSLLLSLVTAIGWAQPQLEFEKLSVEQGLSQSIVVSIVQDARGLLWFATEDGLNLYDGYTFTVLRNDPDDPESISYNHVTTVYEDRAGTLWIGTFNGGLNRYDLTQDRFTRIRHATTDSSTLSSDIINCIIQDRNGSVWVGTQNGLNKLTKGSADSVSFKRYFHDPADPRSLSSNLILSMCLDSLGNLWIGTDAGLNLLDGEDGPGDAARFRRFRHEIQNPASLSHDTVRTLYTDHSGRLWVGTEHGLNKLVGDAHTPAFRCYLAGIPGRGLLNNDEIYAILEDSDGIFWVGTDGGGLNRFDPATETFHAYLNDPRMPNTLSYNEIRSLYQDWSGILWVGTYGGGVNKVDVRKRQFAWYRNDPDDPNTLTENIVWTIFEDPSGVLWIGTHGGGLNRFDRSANRFSSFRSVARSPLTLSSDFVRVVIGDPSGDLWIGTNGGGICRFDPAKGTFRRFLHDPSDSTTISHNEIRSLYLDPRGILWIGTNGGGLNRLDTRAAHGSPPVFTHYRNDPADLRSLSDNFVRVIHEDKSGALWVGTQGGGLNCFDRGFSTFSHFRADPSRRGALNNDFIFCIHEDPQGIFWLGTWGGGINRFDPATGEAVAFTTRDGLPSDAIYGILEDSSGDLWFSTNNGLGRFSPTSHQIRNYSMKDGLQNNEFNGGSYFKSAAGEMFFGGITGFNAFFPEKIHDNPFVPPVVITSFRKLNKEVRLRHPISELSELTLSYRDYVFSFEFAALDYTAPEKNLYAYKMEGLHDDWIFTSAKKRLAQYSTLPPGEYRFRVKGSNKDGVWNDKGASLRIVITPPFWDTWWFRSLLTLSVLVVSFLFYRRRLKNVRLKAELRAAHEIQKIIMPDHDPHVPGFDISGISIPANEVGGDFFDYSWLGSEQKEFCIILGDVSGKAMRAAMTAVMASGVINAEVRNGTRLQTILTTSNQVLFPKMERRMFTAVCLGSFNRSGRVATIANAGLIKPLLLRDGSVEAVDTVGAPFPLGIRRDHEYGERRIATRPGDVFLLQTDGVLEAQNHVREFYGEHRLQDLLRGLETSSLTSHEIRDAILAGVQQFIGKAPQFDDMTVVVLKVL
jgi:ligand-binding sensor domain-containing protein/serine phosphatase RsbU (regulator of sigma subunit)